tara:strand:+ start:1061 stop:1738 length:678 start_codon:yes stop_codon:yes gene_type:complete
MSETNSNVSVSFNTTEEIIKVDKLEPIVEVKETIIETVNEVKETIIETVSEIEKPSLEIQLPPLMTGADEVSLPTFENEINKLEVKVKTDLKAITKLVNAKPEPNSFLIKLEQMVEYIKNTLGDEKITATNIVIISTNLMHIVEQYKDLTGSQKKMLILDTIKKVINQNVNDPQERISLMLIVDMTLPPMLDTLVSAINGGLKFEKDKVISGFKKIFCCGGSKTQ